MFFNYLCDIPYSFYTDRFNYQGFEEIFDLNNFNQKTWASIVSLKRNADENWARIRARTIYGILHSRFILTFPGVEKLMKKIKSKVYGNCNNWRCFGGQILPIGTAKLPNKSKFRSFCSQCREIQFIIGGAKIDGAFFGPDYIFYLYSVFPEFMSINTKTWFSVSFYGFKIQPDKKLVRFLEKKKNETTKKIETFNEREKTISGKLLWKSA